MTLLRPERYGRQAADNGGQLVTTERLGGDGTTAEVYLPEFTHLRRCGATFLQNL